jgi:hypothetical protein
MASILLGLEDLLGPAIAKGMMAIAATTIVANERMIGVLLQK